MSASQALPIKQSRIISKVLSPAIQVWLRSQVEHVEALQVKIEGSDRLILKGHVPKVSVLARHAVYQGLHLSQIELAAPTIRVNLGQILKGKPLRLLEPVPVTGELYLLETNLNASLKAPLLANALTEFFVTLLKAAGVQNPSDLLQNQTISWHQINLGNEQITIRGNCQTETGEINPMEIRGHFQIKEGRQLQLNHLEVEGFLSSAFADLNSFQFDLGSDVEIEEFALIPGQLTCRGRLMVRTD